jgi:hypothetical protein
LIRGQKVHHDEEWNYAFWRPLNWNKALLPNGVVYYPETDVRTGFYVSATDLSADLEADITAEDLPALHEGLLAGLADLPDCEILTEDGITNGKTLGFDFLVTFSLDGAPCKRRLRMLYRGRRQYTLYGQGVPPEEYDVFKNIFDYMYLTFTFGELTVNTGLPPMPDFTKPPTVPETGIASNDEV